MSSFSLRYPFFIVMLRLVVLVVGSTTVARMPVDLFPEINIPVVVVATFYNGMPPEQIESNITNPFPPVRSPPKLTLPTTASPSNISPPHLPPSAPEPFKTGTA